MFCNKVILITFRVAEQCHIKKHAILELKCLKWVQFGKLDYICVRIVSTCVPTIMGPRGELWVL